MKKNLGSLRSNWYIWIFPLFALGISFWLYFQYTQERGTRIRILLKDAATLQAEKTTVRFRGVAVGMVKAVGISPDRENVFVDILLRKDSEHFAVAGSKFWVVTPKVGFQGVTGLETIFEGAYIAVDPGPASGEAQTEFKGQQPAVSTDDVENTSTFLLETSNAESLNGGDSVTFRGLKVGSITKVTLSKTAQNVLVQLNIENRYARLIRTNTVFWRKVGVQAKLGLFNSEVKVNSLDSIMHGGIEFFTPTKAGEPAKNRTKFLLYASPPKDYEKWNPDLDI